MQVILLEKVHRLGQLGETVKVKRGFARNYLIPTGKALPATPANQRLFEVRRAELEKTALDRLSRAEQRALGLSGLRLTIKARVGEEGKLYGSVGAQEVLQALRASDQLVEKQEILLPNGPMRQLGELEVILSLHTDVRVNLNVQVVQEA